MTSETTHVSLDIEALGEVLLSIGAVRFDIKTGNLFEPYCYVVFDGNDQLDAGLRPDMATFRWWLQQGSAAREALQRHNNGKPLPMSEGLAEFNCWCARYAQDAFFWAYPATYDFPLLARVAYRAKMRVPWSWKNVMCARTFATIARQSLGLLQLPEPLPEHRDHHALDDAIEQAQKTAAVIRQLKDTTFALKYSRWK